MEYVRSPKVHTFAELKQKRLKDKCSDYKFKFDRKVKPNEMWQFDSRYINTVKNIKPKNHEVPAEAIPKTYVKQKYKTQLLDKINHMHVFPGYKEQKYFSPAKVIPKIDYKWTTIEDKFRCSLKNRMYDEYPI